MTKFYLVLYVFLCWFISESYEGSYHLQFDEKNKFDFYYYHQKEIHYKQLPLHHVASLQENVNFTVNLNNNEALNDCVNVNLKRNSGQNYDDFISCKLDSAFSVEWMCKLDKWVPNRQEFKFRIEPKFHLNTSHFDQINSSSLSSSLPSLTNGTIQCTFTTSTAGNDKYTFCFPFGPLVSEGPETTPNNGSTGMTSATSPQDWTIPHTTTMYTQRLQATKAAIPTLSVVTVIAVGITVSLVVYHKRMKIKTVLKMCKSEDVKYVPNIKI